MGHMTTTSPTPLTKNSTIIVGLDGSEHSANALRWAANYAKVTGARLHAISAWHFPDTYGWSGPLPAEYNPEGDAKTILDEEIETVLGSEPGVEVIATTRQGHPAEVLAEASREASLLVVGCRGRGEFAGMLLGSVSRYLTAHAHCPVVVVRDGTDAAR